MPNKQHISKIIRDFANSKPSEEVQHLFERWLTDSEDQVEKDDALTSIWDECSSEYSHSDEKVWQRLSSEISSKRDKHSLHLWRNIAIGSAAAVVAVLFVVQYVVLNQKAAKMVAAAEQPAVAPEREVCYVTARDSKGLFTLPDGTIVWLNGESRLWFAEQFDGSQRRVKLEGEGFFDVVKNAERHFVVNIGEREIEVLGTAFDVKNYEKLGYQEVVLVRGSINVLSSNGRVSRLSPNERFIASTADGTESISVVDANDYSQWMSNRLVFDNRPLKNILTNLEHWYNMEIVIDGNMKLDTHLSFNVKYESIDEVMRTLSLLVPIRYRVDYINNKVNIWPR